MNLFFKRYQIFILASFFIFYTTPLISFAVDGKNGQVKNIDEDTSYNNNSQIEKEVVVITVPTSGIRSVNDMTDSDYKITIEQLEDAYSHYDKHDGLTEYFYRNSNERKIENIQSQISWLIQNNIISRDYSITLNYSSSTNFPSISIEKEDLNSILFNKVTKSDFLMYLYKSTFGILNSRGIGIKTNSFRMLKEDGKTSSELKPFLISSWDYKAQGDYIKKNYLDKTDLEINYYVDVDVTGGSGGAGTEGGSGGDGGGANTNINIHGPVDRFQFKPQGDTLLYFSSDIIELYMSAMLNQGLINPKEDNVKEDFIKDEHNKASINNGITSYSVWDSRLNPKIYLGSPELVTPVSELKSSLQNNEFGKGFTINSSSNSLTINKAPLGAPKRSMFTDDNSLSKIDVYKYIYRFIYTNEKVLSELESSIVAYKYNAQLKGLIKDEDIPIVEYLTAKGILNFDKPADFQNLYLPITWNEAFTLLYRVANKDARYDFSTIELTDSEKVWQANGFSERMVKVYANAPDVNLVSLESENKITQTIQLKNTWFSGILKSYDVTLLAENNFQTEYYVEDFTKVKYGKFNFNTNILNMSKENAKKAVEEALSYLKNPDSNKVKLDNFDTTNYGLGQMNIEEASNYLLDNIFIANSNLNLEPEFYQLLEARKKNNILVSSNNNLENISLNMVFDKNISSNSNDPMSISNDTNRADVFNRGLVSFTLLNNSEPIIKMDRTKDANGTYSQNIRKAKFSFSFKDESYTSAETVARTLIGSSLIADQAVINLKVGNNGNSYVALSDIQEKYPYIIKVSDKILKNTNTNSYAYFDIENNTALIGTAVVKTISEPIMKINGELYYDWKIIYRLFPSAVLKNLYTENAMYYSETLSKEDKADIPIYGNDLTGRSKISAIRAVTTYNPNNDTNENENNTLISAPLLGGDINTAQYGTYVYMATIDSNVNLLYRILETNKGEAYAAAILQFIPEDINIMGVNIPKSPTVSKLMDITATMPTSTKGQALWTRNIELGNMYANWIYGTQDIEYIKTGLLKPKLSIMLFPSLTQNTTNSPTSSTNSLIFSSDIETKVLSDLSSMLKVGKQNSLSDFKTKIIDNFTANEEKDETLFSFINSYNIQGHIWAPDTKINDYNNLSSQITDDMSERYIISSDKRFIYLSGRLYLSISQIPFLSEANLFNEKDIYSSGYCLSTANSASTNMQWQIGQNFKMYDSTIGEYTKNATVVAIKDEKAIVQLEPIRGIPYYNIANNRLYMVSSTNNFVNLPNDDLIQSSGSWITDYYADIKMDMSDNIVDNPLAFHGPFNIDTFVVSKTHLYYIPSLGKSAKKTNSVDEIGGDLVTTIENQKNKVTTILADMCGKDKNDVDFSYVYAYPQIQIPMTNYIVKDGKLFKQPSKMQDFMPPILFQSLNQLLVDNMIDESLGAIPLNEIPANSLLTLKNGLYIAQDRTSKKFIGYTNISYLENTSLTMPTQNDIIKSFSSDMINVGNQYYNISRYFKQIDMTTIKGNEEIKNKLDNIMILNKFASLYYKSETSDNIKKVALNQENSSINTISNQNINYAFTEIQFDDGLLAYKISSENDVPLYAILSHSDNPIEGHYNNVPFFDDKVLEDSLLDKTTELTSAGFKMHPDADLLRKAFAEEFNDAFKGDIFTLIRLIFFFLLCYLIVISWVCWGLMFSRARGLLELIKYPSGDSNARGIDVLQWLSLGTVNLDSKFNIGHYLVYNLIIALLLLVVWKIG